MHLTKPILFVLLATTLLAAAPGCKSKKEVCMEEARYKCFGESLEGGPQKFIGSQPVGCKTSIFEHCMRMP
jgi:hypothetical protein